MTTRLNPDIRYARILDAAIKLAEKSHYRHVTRGQIAADVQCSPSLITSYFGDMANLKKQVMKKAVATGNAVLVMQGLTCSDPIAKKAPLTLRKKAAARINA